MSYEATDTYLKLNLMVAYAVYIYPCSSLLLINLWCFQQTYH